MYGTYAAYGDQLAGDSEEPLLDNHKVRIGEARVSVHELSESLKGRTVTGVRIGNVPVSKFGRQLSKLWDGFRDEQEL